METANTPKRVICRYHCRYEREEGAIIDQFFASTRSEHPDYFIHSIPPFQSSKMHTVLDFHYVDHPTPNLAQIPYEVFVVEKKAVLYVFALIVKSVPKPGISIFRKLEDNACKLASIRCRDLYWSADRRRSDEVPGVSA
jgi:hypothetical protein